MLERKKFKVNYENLKLTGGVCDKKQATDYDCNTARKI